MAVDLLPLGDPNNIRISSCFETSAQWLSVDAPLRTHGSRKKKQTSRIFLIPFSWPIVWSLGFQRSVLVKVPGTESSDLEKDTGPQSLTYPLPSWKLTYPLLQGTFESMIFRTSPGGICSRSLEGSYPEKSCLEEDPFLLGWPISGALVNFHGVDTSILEDFGWHHKKRLVHVKISHTKSLWVL